jgi:hypothetical protein
MSASSFVGTLKAEELELLRRIVRKVHFAHLIEKFGPTHPAVTDKECDRLIEVIGPEVAERMVRFGVDKGLR